MFKLSTRQSGILFALVTACGLGAITTQAKLVYADGGNALTLMLVRYLISVIAFGLILLIGRQRFKVAPEQRPGLFLVGIIWSSAMIFYLLSVERISVSLAVLILYSYPLQVLAYGLLRRQLNPSLSLIILFAGAFAGLYLALSGGEIVADGLGLLFASLASIGAAFTFVCGAKVAPKMSPLLMTFWVNAVGLVLVLPLIWNQLELPVSMKGNLALTAATVFYLIAILSQFQALARLSAARASFLLNLEPVVSILLAFLVINEILSLTQWAGVILVIGVVLLSIKFQPAEA